MERQPDSRKGDNGRVLVIGGSEKYVGAPFLAGMAALRAGADLVYVAAPEKVAWTLNSMSPDLITHKCSGWDVEVLLQYASQMDVVLIGSGLEPENWIRDFVRACKIPMVIDAGALHVVHLDDPCKAVFTPHQKEYEELVRNIADPAAMVGNSVILKKGVRDEIIAAGQIERIEGGNAGMTVGGTGDVLAGIVAGLIAQGNDAYEAARHASVYNKAAGDYLYETCGYGYVASDFLDVIPHIIDES
ncbi:MAG: NAD(P)H-hydrate dehydratase [Nanoarchaeota archaeon]